MSRFAEVHCGYNTFFVVYEQCSTDTYAHTQTPTQTDRQTQRQGQKEVSKEIQTETDTERIDKDHKNLDPLPVLESIILCLIYIFY